MRKDYSTAGSRLATSGWTTEHDFEETLEPKGKFVTKYVAEDPPEKRSFHEYYENEIKMRPGKSELFHSAASVDIMNMRLEINYGNPGEDIAIYVDESAQEYVERIEDAADDGEAFESFILKALTDRDATDEDIWLIG